MFMCNIVSCYVCNTFFSVLVYGVCVWEGECGWMYATEFMWQPEDNLRCQPLSSSLFPSRSLVHCCVCQGGLWASRDAHLHSLAPFRGAGITHVHYLAWFLNEFWGFQRRPGFCDKCFTHWDFLPAPRHIFIYFEQELFLDCNPGKFSFWF